MHISWNKQTDVDSYVVILSDTTDNSSLTSIVVREDKCDIEIDSNHNIRCGMMCDIMVTAHGEDKSETTSYKRGICIGNIV